VLFKEDTRKCGAKATPSNLQVYSSVLTQSARCDCIMALSWDKLVPLSVVPVWLTK